MSGPYLSAAAAASLAIRTAENVAKRVRVERALERSLRRPGTVRERGAA